MKKALCWLLLFVAGVSAVQAADDGGLDMGYNTSWTARIFYNPGRGFDNSWPQLCQAREGDVYTVSLPYATAQQWQAQVQFKTPVTLMKMHTYRLTLVAKTLSGDPCPMTVVLAENENDQVRAAYLETVANGDTVVIDDIAGTDIADMKLWFDFGGNSQGTKVEISGISLVDKNNSVPERWVGSVYYTQCYYAPGGQRTADPDIEGTVPSLAWTLPDFKDSAWEKAEMPIGNSGFIDVVRTIWQGSQYNNYWIRRNFTLDEVKSTSRYMLDVLHDDTYAIYVNGHLIDEADDWTIGKEAIHFEIPYLFLKQGNNVIAVYQQQNVGGKFFDCGLTVTPDYYDESDDVNPAEALVANEIQVANIDRFIDHSFNYGAWLELYNTTDKTVNLGGLYLSDDPDYPTKYMIPMNYGTVKPHGYATLFFDHNAADGTYGPTANKQVRFNLDDAGGTIYVADNAGKVFIEQDYPPAVSRCSYARQTDGTGEWALTGEPTPGASNNSSDFSDERLDAPQPDTDSRLFTEPFTVNVTIPEGATLRYTTDGSTPVESSPVSADGVFQISSTTPLRLRLFQKGCLPSPVTTRSYIRRDRDYYLPILSINTAHDNLYGDSIGVYCQGVNGVTGHGNNSVRNNLNMDWVRPVNVEYITADNRMVINQEAEFGIIGGWSRLYAPSSFRLKAKAIYEGNKSFNYPFFHTKPYNKYKELLVRNGGNDNDSKAHGRIKDAIIQQTLSTSGVYVDCQALQPTHVFFNGQYIGMLNLRDPSNKYFATANYGYDKDFMDAFEYSNGYFQKAGDNKAYNEWVSLAANASDEATYDVLRDRVDMDEYINHAAAMTYIGSSDWICNNNNLKGFRSRPDGKFHIVLFDVDWGFKNAQGLSTLMGSNANDYIRTFKNMMKNARLKRQFIDSYCLMHGSVFTPERSKAVGDSLARLFEPALAFEGKQPWTSYNELVPNMTDESRREQHIQALRNTMGLGQGMHVKLSANIPEAQLRVNSLNVPLNRFDGTLFALVTLEASAPAGYNFAGWQTNKSVSLISWGDAWNFWDKGSLDLVVWADVDNSNNWTLGHAPIGYGKNDIATTTQANLPCYYFQKNVTFDDEPENAVAITLNYVADDGFIVYVNGTEAARHLMPEGRPAYDTFATDYAPGNPDRGSITLPKSLFRKGENIIAAEVHNNKLASTDIYWDAQLILKTTSGETFSTERTVTLATDADQTLTAVFEPIDSIYRRYAGATPVIINEVSAANAIYANDHYKRNDWLELYNTTADTIDINGMYLSDDIDNRTKYRIRADAVSTLIPPHGHLIVWADQLDPLRQLHAGFKLGNRDGECVILTAGDLSWSDTLRYVPHTGEESVGRYPDGGKRVFRMTRPTPAAANQLTTYATWLYGNDTDFDPSSVEGIATTTAGRSPVAETHWYSPSGLRLTAPQRGINIVKSIHEDCTDTTRKVVVR